MDGITNSMGMSLGKLCELAGEGNGNLLNYSCLENPMDRGAWYVTYSPWGCKESETTEQLTELNTLLLV